jgi:hypothetical protein
MLSLAIGVSIVVMSISLAADSHIRVAWAAATFRRCPGDIAIWVFDVACFAVNAILGVNDEAQVFPFG